MAARKAKPRDLEPYDGNNGRVNRCADLMRTGKIRTGGDLLDVGGAIGDLGYAVRDLFDERWVVDIAEKNRSAAVAKGNLFQRRDVDQEGLGFKENSFDTVVALDFIEHIVDPENFARECHRVLKPGGEVFVNTPNIRFWRHIEQLWKAGRFPHTSGDREVYHGGHLAFYTYSDLREIFEPAGFESAEQLKDDQGFSSPPNWCFESLRPKTQQEFVALSLELGCPNLLYKAVVRK